MSDKIVAKVSENLSYEQIIKDILDDKEFNKLADIIHHRSTNRFAHSLRVSYFSYIICKKLGFDYHSAARSGLLHDFYFDLPCDQETSKEKRKLMLSGHPVIAIENSKNKFGISEKEIDAIRCHMFPLDFKLPRYRESWVVMLADKFASWGEYGYKCSYTAMVGIIFMFNWLYK